MREEVKNGGREKQNNKQRTSEADRERERENNGESLRGMR